MARECRYRHRKGRVAPGSDADLIVSNRRGCIIVVDGDPIADPDALHCTRAVYACGTAVPGAGHDTGPGHSLGCRPAGYFPEVSIDRLPSPCLCEHSAGLGGMSWQAVRGECRGRADEVDRDGGTRPRRPHAAVLERGRAPRSTTKLRDKVIQRQES